MTITERVFSNRYAAERLIARGGMAEVYLAHDQLLDRKVALKVLSPEFARDPSFVERFRREAQAAANLNDKNIVSIYDWGHEDDTYFIVMEYVDGRSLREILNEHGALSATDAAEIGAEIASALASANAHGVVHRDVKPGNVLITASGLVKVTDFGIARAGTSEALTQTGNVMGTATYFSPEQAQGLPVDGRSDVYSLGVVLYEMVAGETPFQGDNPVAVAYKHVREEPMPLAQRVPDVPADYAAIVNRCLAKNPSDRYPDAAELRNDLARFGKGQPIAPAPMTAIVTTVEAPTVANPSSAARAATTSIAATVGAPKGPMRRASTNDRNRTVMTGIIIALAAILGLVVIALVLFMGNDSSPKSVGVPNVVGQTFDAAAANLTVVGLKAVRDDVTNDTAPIGQVVGQKPDGGSSLKKGSSVTLSVSAGPGDATIPNVVGQSVESASAQMTSAGLKVSTAQQSSDQVPINIVLSTNPIAGTKAARGSTVTLTVSSGAQKIAVPNVVGLDQASAANQLGQAGFSVKTSTEASESVANGKIIKTDPAAGTELTKGAVVTMTISSGPAKVTVPNVVGQTQASATSALGAIGLNVTVNTQVSTPANVGNVLAQSPTGGSAAEKGSTVTITVGVAAPTTTTT
ncbi:MAG: Stk1 family PASTA domain-containing Ser/Thr kinase [Acidimicrobiia bacterium]